METLEQGVKYVRRSGIFIVSFEHISHLVNLEHLITGWVRFIKVFVTCGLSIKLEKSFSFQKFIINLTSIVTLKSPIDTKFS